MLNPKQIDFLKGSRLADQISRFNRRHILRIGGPGLLGLTIPGLLQAQDNQRSSPRKARAKSVIFLFQWGGPSHIDMFDRKPSAPDGIRGPLENSLNDFSNGFPFAVRQVAMRQGCLSIMGTTP